MNKKKNQAQFAESLVRRLAGLQGDPWLAQRIMANEKYDGKPVVKKISASMALMIALLVLSLSVAYALTRPAVFSWLLGNGDVSEALEKTVQEVVAENSADHITVRVNSLVWDGERFVVSYELENDQPDQPAMIVVDSQISVNGQTEGLESTAGSAADPQMVPSPRLDVLPVRRNPTDGGAWSLPFSQVLEGDVTCTIHFIVYRPAKGFVVISSPEDGIHHLDEYDEDSQAELLDAWSALNSFALSALAVGEEDDVQQWVKEGYTVIAPSGMILGEYDNSTLLYNMQATCRIPVTFHFDAMPSDVYDFSDTADIALPDCTLSVHKLRFSPLTTVVDISLIPETNSREAAQELVLRYGKMTLLNEQGDPVDYSSMDYLYDQDPWVTENWHENGCWACTYLIEMPGLQTWPQSIDIRTEGGYLLRLEIDSP